MFIDLITDQENGTIAQQILKDQNVFMCQDTTGRIVRRIDDDGLGLAIDGIFYLLPIDPVCGKLKRYANRNAAIGDDVRNITVIGGLKNYHLISRLENGGKSGIDGIAAARGDGDIV